MIEAITGEVPDTSTPDPMDMELMLTVDPNSGYCDPFLPVRLRNVIGAALRTGRTMVEVAERLAALGLAAPHLHAEPPALPARVPAKG